MERACGHVERGYMNWYNILQQQVGAILRYMLSKNMNDKKDSEPKRKYQNLEMAHNGSPSLRPLAGSALSAHRRGVSRDFGL